MINIKNKYQAIILDFDGVVVDSNNSKAEAFSKLFEIFGKDVQNKIKKYHLSNLGVARNIKIKYINEKILQIKKKDLDFNNQIKKFSKIVISKVVNSKFITGFKSFANHTNHKKIYLFLSSATPLNELKIILKKKDINIFFTEVFGSPLKKNYHIKNIINKYKLDKKKVLFVGDSANDLYAAKLCSVDFILMKNEYNRDISDIKDILSVNNFTDINI